MASQVVRNRWTFAVGTFGRDMVYTLVSLYLIYYLTEALDLSDWALGWVTVLVLAARLFDAVMDIVMGGIVDNTRTRWGSYKPWILGGVIASGLVTVVLFTDVGWSDVGYVVFFSLAYLAWGLSWTTNDIPYWSLMPALTLDKSERERIGSLAKVFGTLGLTVCVVGVIPITTGLATILGKPGAWTAFAVGLVVVMIVGQFVTLIGVREPGIAVDQGHTSLKQVASIVLRNDQLLVVAIAQTLFMAGYVTTTSFGTYYFKYVFRDEAAYTPFGAVLLLAQLAGFLVFPLVAKRMTRRTLYTVSIALIVVGYGLFYGSPVSLLAVGAAGLLLFVGQSWVVMLMLLFIADTVDYGHWKLGRRNQAVTFALQPFVNKVGGALATAIVGATAIVSGINDAKTPDDVTATGLGILKVAMLVLPAILIVVGFVLWRLLYRLDEARCTEILTSLREQGQLIDLGEASSSG